MVDSTNLPEVDINQIATDLNGKMDRDCLNASDTGNIQMANASMPSDTYIDLTLGASGATYTAPADGWFCVRKIATGSGQYINLINMAIIIDNFAYSNGNYVGVFIPAQKGQTVTCQYSLGGAVQFFRFYYAQGSESEAN